MPSVTVKLNDVQKSEEIFQSIDIVEASKVIEDFNLPKDHEFLEDFLGKNKFRDSAKKQRILKFTTGEVNHRLIKSPYQYKHFFINTLLTAYNCHMPLELSPDDFWALISLGVAQHLGHDEDLAETYRKSFVDHSGKKELLVDGTGLVDGQMSAANKIGWPVVIEKLCQLIKGNTKSDLATIMTSPFSTSGQVEPTVYNCLLMETMKNYFLYKVYTLCGIPEITVHGTVDDWQSILYRLDQLKKIFIDFSWYFDQVSQHVCKVLSMVKGDKPDLKYWKSMIFESDERESGERPKLFGWIVDFFPYIFEEGQRIRIKNEVDIDSLNSPAVTLTDFKLDDLLTQIIYDMKLCGGFVGISQNQDTKAVRPALGWIVYHAFDQV